jgi:hypothetical protein
LPQGLHYTPIIVNGNNSIEVEGILIGETYGPITDLYIIDKSYFSFEEGDKTYFAGIFQFFRESVNGATPDKELYFRSRKCTPDTDNSDPEPQYIGPCECPASWECAIQEYSSDCFNAECVPGNPNNGGGGNDNGGSGGDDDDGTNGNDNNGSTFNIFDIFGNWFFGSKWFQDFWGVGGDPSGGGGGSWSSSDPLLPNGFFNQFAFDDPLEWEVARQVNNFRAKYSLYHVNSAQLLQLLNNCGHSDYTSILNLMGAGNGSGFPDCVKSILENADGLVLDPDELIDIFGNNVYNTDFPARRKSALIQYLKDLAGFSSGAETWLTSYERPMSFTVEFYEFLREEEFSVQSLNFVKDLLNWVASSGVDLSNEEVIWLLNNKDFTLESFSFLAEYPNGELPIAYVKFVLESRDVWGDVGLDILNPFEEYANNLAILESESTLPPQEIQNGIEIFTSYLPGYPQTPIGAPFGGSDVNPIGGPDLDFDTDGDLSILTPGNQEASQLPADVQDNRMEWLFYMATFLDASGESVADDYLAEFHENEAKFDYYNEQLSTMVMNSTQMRNWLKTYGKDLNDELIETEGDIDEVIAPSDVSRPALNESHALTILINDTQKTNVYRLDSYNYDTQTGEWDCHFLVNVIDHFGLDDDDVIDFQNHFPGGNGFIAWWALQHRYGWAPFRTDIWFVVHLGGKI